MLVFRESADRIDPGEVHREAPVADLHAHPGLTAYWLKRDLTREHRPPAHGYNPLRQQLDLPRMLQGGLRVRSEEHTSELQSLAYLVCRLLLEKKKKIDRLSKRSAYTS